MTQIDSAALEWRSLTIAGKAMFTIAVSSTDATNPMISVRIAQYRCGSGSPSSAVFVILAALITNQRAPLQRREGSAKRRDADYATICGTSRNRSVSPVS